MLQSIDRLKRLVAGVLPNLGERLLVRSNVDVAVARSNCLLGAVKGTSNPEKLVLQYRLRVEAFLLRLIGEGHEHRLPISRLRCLEGGGEVLPVCAVLCLALLKEPLDLRWLHLLFSNI